MERRIARACSGSRSLGGGRLQRSQDRVVDEGSVWSESVALAGLPRAIDAVEKCAMLYNMAGIITLVKIVEKWSSLPTSLELATGEAVANRRDLENRTPRPR